MTIITHNVTKTTKEPPSGSATTTITNTLLANFDKPITAKDIHEFDRALKDYSVPQNAVVRFDTRAGYGATTIEAKW
jgi:hypothetical protein